MVAEGAYRTVQRDVTFEEGIAGLGESSVREGACLILRTGPHSGLVCALGALVVGAVGREERKMFA